MIGRRERRLFVASLVALAACGRAAPIAPRVVHGTDDEPFRGADALFVAVEQNGVELDGATTRVPVPATAFELDGVPFGRGLTLRVETRLGDVVLARGRSFPFDYPSFAEAPAVPPDVFIGTLGRFASALATDRAIVALAPTERGALAVTREGEALVYEPHGAPDGSARLVSAGVVAGRDGAQWVALAGIEGVMLGVGGSSAGATLLDAGGVPVAELDGAHLRAVADVGLASAADGTWVIVVGGTAGDGAVLTDVVRVDVTAGGLEAVALAAMSLPRVSPSAVRVSATDGASAVDVVLVVGGGEPRSVVLIDPLAASTDEMPIDPPRDLDRRALVAVETGLVVAAGGADASGASAAVDLFLVRRDQEPSVARVTPAPPLLFTARQGALALPLGPGLALVLGGVGTMGEPALGAELVEGTLTGRVVPTGALPAGTSPHAAAQLRDRSVLVAADGALFVYVPPRGPT